MKCKRIMSTAILFLFFIGFGASPPKAEAGQHTKAVPMAARMVLAKASGLLNQKEYQKALEILTAFQGRCPAETTVSKSDRKGYHHPEVYFAIGTCYLLKDAHKEAVHMYEKALEKDSGHISAWLNLGKATYEIGEYSRAAQCFLKAYEHTATKNPEHLYNAATAYLMARDYQQSIHVFDTLLTRHPADVRNAWRETYVHALVSTGLSRRALPHIRVLAEAYEGEKKVQWQEILLDQYIQLDMREEAFRYALSLTRGAPTRAKWWKALTHVHLQAGRYVPALTALTIYGFLSPLSDSETKLLADLNLQVGIPVKAAAIYETALAIRLDETLLYNLMLAFRETGQPEKALQVFDRLALDCKKTDLLMLRAELLYELERFPEAGKAFVKLAEAKTGKSDQKGRAWLMAGYAAIQANDMEAGHQALNKATEFKPHRKAALLAMRQLSISRFGTRKEVRRSGSKSLN